MLRRRGLIGEARHDTNETAPIDEAIDGCRLAGLSRGRFEKSDEHGRAQQRLFPDDDVRFARRNNSAWAANVDGFSVEAGVHFGALDRKGRERLVRNCLRPPIAMERFSILRDGSIAQLTKYPRGRATHRVMSGIECMARLAALVPPRFALWRYHGVLAPASPWRSRVVPHSPATTNARGADASAAQPTKLPSGERLEYGSPTPVSVIGVRGDARLAAPWCARGSGLGCDAALPRGLSPERWDAVKSAIRLAVKAL
jgi:hypothetical protein